MPKPGHLSRCPQRYWSGDEEWLCGIDEDECEDYPLPPRDAADCPRFVESSIPCPECILAQHTRRMLLVDSEPGYEGTYYTCPGCPFEATPEELTSAYAATCSDLLSDVEYLTEIVEGRYEPDSAKRLLAGGVSRHPQRRLPRGERVGPAPRVPPGDKGQHGEKKHGSHLKYIL
jgi:hypothetical protein